jgi:hypothetical protein
MGKGKELNFQYTGQFLLLDKPKQSLVMSELNLNKTVQNFLQGIFCFFVSHVYMSVSQMESKTRTSKTVI